ncbi:hypothetical protein GS429_20935 [Natronorubrum sp. JWXQ-INN-674]|uniref:Uncharacterized protein n=1 Tax=Natronorubrum halalkaliphilum TaxID=2691917 RepID=A0A6B0VS74_9EURY|nr:hypothetical protein [Natronorubrum halalkaliphilum]MXV64490.1 hypothetical protein [Natronorubrum halalkaliphilum]
MADSLLGILKLGEVLIDAIVSLSGRMTGSDRDDEEEQTANETGEGS